MEATGLHARQIAEFPAGQGHPRPTFRYALSRNLEVDMTTSFFRSRFRWTLAAGVSLLLACAAALAADPGGLPKVVVIATGGTIAGVAASSTEFTDYKSAKVGIQALIDAIPGLRQAANVRGEQLFQISSTSMTNDHWLKLAHRVNKLLAQDDVDGIVVTHGTDTLEETAYFLNLVVKSRKPVVVVGSMRPSSAISADGPINLYDAVCLAASPNAVGKGVLVVLNDQISGARDVTKTNTSNTDTFRNWELGFMGYMRDGVPHFYHVSARKNTVETEFDVSGTDVLPQVDIVYGYVNMNGIAVDAFVAAGTKAIIFAGTGEGTVADSGIEPALIEARKKGVVVVRSSRVGNGLVTRSAENRDDEFGFVVADTLSPQKARILAMLALTRTHDVGQIQRMFYEY
jgi:L-asparaginase